MKWAMAAILFGPLAVTSAQADDAWYFLKSIPTSQGQAHPCTQTTEGRSPEQFVASLAPNITGTVERATTAEGSRSAIMRLNFTVSDGGKVPITLAAIQGRRECVAMAKRLCAANKTEFCGVVMVPE